MSLEEMIEFFLIFQMVLLFLLKSAIFRGSEATKSAESPRCFRATSTPMSPTKTDRVAAFLNKFSIFFFWMKDNLISYLMLNFYKNRSNNKPVGVIQSSIWNSDGHRDFQKNQILCLFPSSSSSGSSNVLQCSPS